MQVRTAEEYFNRGAAMLFSNRNAAIADLNEAIRLYSEDIFLNPDAITYYKRGLAHTKLCERDAAIEDCSAAIRLKPDYAQAYRLRSNNHYYLKQYHAALDDCNEVIRLKPDCSDSYSNRGTVLQTLGQDALAMYDYLQALELNPNNTLAEVGLDIDRKTKPELFELIEKLPNIKKIQLLKQCQDGNSILGKRFLKPEGQFIVSYYTQDDRAMLEKIKRRISDLTMSMKTPLILLMGSNCFPVQQFPRELSYLITGYFLELSGLEFSSIGNFQPKISQFKSIMFPMPDKGSQHQSSESIAQNLKKPV